MSSQRSRNVRGPNRNNGGSGEEFTLWLQIQEDLRAVVEEVNTSNDNTREIIAQDSFVARNSDSADFEQVMAKLDTLLRGGVRITDTLTSRIRSVIDKLQVLKAVQKSKEDAESQTAAVTGSSGRDRSGGLLTGSGRTASARVAGNRDREREKEKDRDVYDFDGAGDSPVPSPVGGHTRKLGSGGGAGSDRSGNRDSVPPRGGDRDTPAKADSVEPQLPSGAAGAIAAQRSKVNFLKGQDVAFKPKPATAGETTDWYLGKVQIVLGEGKSRRYKVRDEDPTQLEEERAEYRTSASSMIPIPSATTELPPLEKGKTVLAMYPSTTTFYKAAVVGTDADTGKINLRFDGEETTGTLQLVERRYVLEYRS